MSCGLPMLRNPPCSLLTANWDYSLGNFLGRPEVL
jgi:hypothetical protein